jgi:hypothetical protein
MQIKLSITTALTAAAAAALLAAPMAAAAPTPLPKVCVDSGASSTCQSPGNVEIHSSSPAVRFHPYGDMPFLLGGD